MILKRFCWCCDLRSGAVFIGIVQNLIALPAFILSFVSFGFRQQISHALHINAANQIIPLITLVSIFCSFLKLCSCILLISGATRRSHLELMPWLIIEGIGMFALSIIIMIFTVFVLHVGLLWGLVLFLIGNLFIGISIYWWLCVYSLYRTYQDEESIKYTDIERLIQT